MKYVFALVLLALTGCSSFKLGGMTYCPYGENCSFQQVHQEPAQEKEKS